LTAVEAKFDGAKGLRMLVEKHSDCRFKLLRGKQNPSSYPEKDFTEQLVWIYPDNSAPKLYWCNEDNQWFELQFQPIEKP